MSRPLNNTSSDLPSVSYDGELTFVDGDLRVGSNLYTNSILPLSGSSVVTLTGNLVITTNVSCQALTCAGNMTASNATVTNISCQALTCTGNVRSSNAIVMKSSFHNTVNAYNGNFANLSVSRLTIDNLVTTYYQRKTTATGQTTITITPNISGNVNCLWHLAFWGGTTSNSLVAVGMTSNVNSLAFGSILLSSNFPTGSSLVYTGNAASFSILFRTGFASQFNYALTQHVFASTPPSLPTFPF